MLKPLTIRNPQMAALEEAQRQEFGKRTIAFIRERYPEACSRFGDQAVRDMVALSLRKAREHGLTARSDILRYINVMYTLGCEFESDPRYPWAREIMSQPRLRPESKINQLTARTIQYLQSLEQA